MYYNRSYNYALPMLDWWDSSFLVNSQFRACFLADESCPDLTNHIFILYKYTGDRWFQGYEEELKDTEYFVDSYEPTKLHTMYVFKVPEWHDHNMKMLKESKFSLFEDNFKRHVIDFHGESKTKNIVSVMYRHESAYLELEKYINKDLPQREWTKIPRDVDPAKLLDMENEERYTSKIKFKEDGEV